jgi:hypothetical protein
MCPTPNAAYGFGHSLFFANDPGQWLHSVHALDHALPVPKLWNQKL